ncbi:unnamed protein product [Rotaria sp. Silwood2]|nr:unnamed protein product [Rotaria sp. Silwood2]CAF2641383.1 unnamed protein product [Rotaria sp. Silwood2]CAF3050121.1 unnamed protein product [Rotaria sp. Silwood2]CAF4233596.1 unnamed protein product [Rotaria sp. Silwood2]CAF4267502.1 unnamed protein product [Rotaria sp. Silwood2]
MSLQSNASNKINQHIHHSSDEQLICDSEQCREKVLNKIKQINNEIKNDFHIIVQNNSNDNKINLNQAWNIMHLISKKLSIELISLFHKEEISQIIETYIEQNDTKQTFEKVFNYEKKQNFEEFLTKEQLWNIYLNMCEDAIKILSKTNKKNTINYTVVDKNF